MNERRHQIRHRVLKSAKIVFNQKFCVVDCTVRSLSDGGACIQLSSIVGIPDTFELQIDRGHRDCRVAWRSVNRVGVRFANC